MNYIFKCCFLNKECWPVSSVRCTVVQLNYIMIFSFGGFLCVYFVIVILLMPRKYLVA